MDLASLATVLQAALSPHPEQREAAEANLNQVIYFYIQFTKLISFFSSWLLILQMIDSDQLS